MRADAHDAGKTAVTFVNRFTLRGRPEEFERVFAESSEFMAEQPGFVQHTLLRHMGEPGAYVNIAHWADEASFHRAVSHPAFVPHAQALRELSTSEPNLYRPRLRRDAGGRPAWWDRPAGRTGDGTGDGAGDHARDLGGGLGGGLGGDDRKDRP